MSKRKPNAQTHFDSDPSRLNIRDPEQKNDELAKHEPAPKPEPQERGVIPPEKH